MRRETVAKKLLETLGLQEKFDPDVYSEDPKKVKKAKSRLFAGIPEEEIQKRREAQGLIYFLQAPDLFQSKICKHCQQPFLVSRHQVSMCSYTCIEKELEKLGIKWSKSGNYESIIKDVYEGNEPIWIRNIDFIKQLVKDYEQNQADNDQSLLGV